MNKEKMKFEIEKALDLQVKKDIGLKNAYLLVHCEPKNIHIDLARGNSSSKLNPQQPNYMASVGKIFTSTIIGLLYEENKLNFEDKVAKYLEDDLMREIHIHNNIDYSKEIRIRHLLNHTSGLADNFWPLIEEVVSKNDPNYTNLDAIKWVKTETNAVFPPGESFQYTDTNYHLLGLIIESITGMLFSEVLRKRIFEPVNMRNSYMNYYSKPIDNTPLTVAEFFINGEKLNDNVSYAKLDYSGGGVISTTNDLLKFIKALNKYKLVSKNTLDIMKKDNAKFGFGIKYGYGIWMINHIPILMPKKYSSWGVAGATGSFMFYNLYSDTYIIGNFNDFSYQKRGLQFMLSKVLSKVTKHLG